METDVAIIGAGPAGLFAAYELTKHTDKLDIIIIDRGYDVEKRKCPINTFSLCTRCNPCHIMCGVGGAGTLSSGLLNLRPDIGGDLTALMKNADEAERLVKYVDDIFLFFGAPKELYYPDPDSAEELSRKAAAVGIEFVPIPQRHIGTDNAPKVIKNIKEYLVKKKVKFMLGTEVESIEKGYLKLKNGTTIEAKYILAAPGRVGANWMASQAAKLGIHTYYEPIDVGVRVEIPAIVLDPVFKIARDPKFHIYTKTYDDFVRTFCVNHKGFVVEEVYDGFVGVNGHAMVGKRSQNSNFAFLVRIGLTEPLEDTTAYARSIASQVSILGGKKPLIQRLGDLRQGHRSTWERISRSGVKPTLKSVTPGDIAMALPHRILTDILEGLDKLDAVIPGVASSSTLLYAPEIKFSANRVPVNENMESPVENLFVAGDGVGLSRGLVTAAATGILAAQGILKKHGIL
ncbi:MAG: NAD(P)/FAD-dependent oxidoreductase [Candidatus Odinarchaeia archaeon]